MPEPAELVLILMVVAVILTVHKLGRFGDAVGHGLSRLLGRGDKESKEEEPDEKTAGES